MNTFTDPLTLAQEIIDGKRITREDDLSFFLTCDLQKLTEVPTVSGKPGSETK